MRARDDEETFTLLGRDAAAPATIRFWMEERIRLGKNTGEDEQITEAAMCATQMEMDRVAPVVVKINPWWRAPLLIAASGILGWTLSWLISKQFDSPRGAIVTGQCSGQQHKEPKPPVRTVAQMGIGESACSAGLIVDSEHRGYLFRDEAVDPYDPATQLCSGRSITREKDGYYVTCGKDPLPEPTSSPYAEYSWVIPVRGFR